MNSRAVGVFPFRHGMLSTRNFTTEYGSGSFQTMGTGKA